MMDRREKTRMKNSEQVKSVIFRTVGNHKWLSLGIAVSVCGAVVTSLIPPLILGKIIDGLTAGQALAFSMVLSYFGMLALTGLTESLREGFLTVFGQKITHALRSSLMDKFTRLTADELNKQEPGTLVSRFVGDVDMVENLFTSGIISMFADACRIISILAVIWFQNRGLALVFVILLPALFGFTRFVQKRMLAAQLENRKAVGRASAFVPESLHNIRTIHCLGKENYMEKRYDQYIGESYRAMEKTNFYDAGYSPVILVLNAIVVAVVMALSASGNPKVLSLFGMSAGTAVAVMNYISQIFAPVESLGMEIQTIQSALAGIHRINDFFGLPERKPETAGVTGLNPVTESTKIETLDVKTENTDPKAFVELKNVTFGYDDRIILDHINIQVQKGEQVTLSGRTGAGKSTIFKLLLGLYEPQDGQVLIKGIPAGDISESKKRTLFGYVEQSFHMVPGTVKDQITLYDDSIPDEAVKQAAKMVGLDSSIEALEHGYDTICTPEVFSQGQWQLLSIARAAVTGPELLLLDEITANLDAETERAVLQALKQVSANRTVVSISHRFSAEMGRIIKLTGVDEKLKIC